MSPKLFRKKVSTRLPPPAWPCGVDRLFSYIFLEVVISDNYTGSHHSCSIVLISVGIILSFFYLISGNVDVIRGQIHRV